jgi:hypothetical protein
MTLYASFFGKDVIPDSRRPPRDRPLGVRVVRRPSPNAPEERR